MCIRLKFSKIIIVLIKRTKTIFKNEYKIHKLKIKLIPKVLKSGSTMF